MGIRNQVNWRNPYEKKGPLRLKGNLHTHTSFSGCGKIPLRTVIDIYEKMEYGFLAITDHNLVTDVTGIKTSLVLLTGIEADFKGNYHTCIVNPDKNAVQYFPGISQQELIDKNRRSGGLAVLNHPDWQIREHYTMDELYNLRNYSGIEIYNTVIERLDGGALATVKWDRLLENGKKGRRILGFANQDSHKSGDYLDCCNVVMVRKKSATEVFRALVTGCFYCYFGVEIIDIGRKRNTVFVETKNASLIRFIGNGGVVFKKFRAKQAEISFKDYPDAKYIRVEALGIGDQISWSQPFFR